MAIDLKPPAAKAVTAMAVGSASASTSRGAGGAPARRPPAVAPTLPARQALQAVRQFLPARGGGGGAGLGLRDRMMFTERLALLLDTGVSLHEALASMQAQAGKPALLAIVAAMSEDILDGKPLSVALRRHPRMFPPTYVNLVAAAENGGFLPQVLQQLIETDEKAERLRTTLTSALSYPIFLFCFSSATVLFVLVGVFPKFSDMFAGIRDELPATTRVLMGLSNSLLAHWPWWIGALLALAVGTAAWWQRPTTRDSVDRLLLRAPGLRDLCAQLYLSQTLRVLGLSLANGVPMVDALHACRELVRNAAFRRFIDALQVQVTEGRGIAYGFHQADFMPAMVQQMIATGEETGTLAKVMTRIADFYERELTKRIAMLSRLAEPVMLLVMGAVVGLIVASLILPIFKLSRAVH